MQITGEDACRYELLKSYAMPKQCTLRHQQPCMCALMITIFGLCKKKIGQVAHLYLLY